ncbi:MAG: hypothetical protein ACTSRP_03390 [Candidatus Helarchaeota archaeon]
MPRKEIEYKIKINVRVTEAQYERWTKFAEDKNNNFTSLSSMIRYAVEELIEDKFMQDKMTEYQSALQKEIRRLTQQNEELLAQNRKILEIIAKKSPPPKDNKIREFQRETIINLLRDEALDEEEIRRKVHGLTEVETLKILNELLGETIIVQEKDKYRTREGM